MDHRVERRGTRLVIACCMVSLATGCYAPLHSPGIPARNLPDEFRVPSRTVGPPLNYSLLAAPTSPSYLLGTGDILEVTVPDLIQRGDARPLRVQVLETGEIHLPRVGPVIVGGQSLAQAQWTVNQALAAGMLQNPGVSLTVIEKGTVNVLVLGAVQKPGIHALTRTENDVAHALAAAGGFAEDAGDVIEVHRRGSGMMQPVYSPTPMPIPIPTPVPVLPPAPIGVITPTAWQAPQQPMPQPIPQRMPTPVAAPIPSVGSPSRPGFSAPAENRYRSYRSQTLPGPKTSRPTIRGQSPGPIPQTWSPQPYWIPEAGSEPIVRIPLRGGWCPTNPTDVVLSPGDVVVVPPKTDQVFYVVGPLSAQSRVRFSVGDKDREIGNGLLLPPDREIDVITAVAMAGYIDPIESPTTVTVHRTGPDGRPLLIRVDLIAARSDPAETILVQPGDIVYLNPDHLWYTRRLIDRTIDTALGVAVGRWLTN